MCAKIINFTNEKGIRLSGRLDLPADQHPHSYALFAHCFTCSKNLHAVRNISRALTSKGFGVLRFDFTGLGQSEGDFTDTDFSANITDLVSAAEYLKENHEAPVLMIGHSLGGAAALFAADTLMYIQAVATIAAPSHPNHVTHLFGDDLEKIEENGKATVNIGGRDFTIKKDFLDDLQSRSLTGMLPALRKPLLVLHSPQDTIVGISNAREIYEAAHHPKSFISLDKANHLLTREEDSKYVGEVIAGWAGRYITLPKPETISSDHEVVARLEKGDQYTTTLKLGDHYMSADEPVQVGGNNFGPTPYELLSSALAACTAMTIKMYTERKSWPLESIEVHISYSKQHKKDSSTPENHSARIDVFEREIHVEGIHEEEQLTKLLEIADKCPVHRTLMSETRVQTRIINA